MALIKCIDCSKKISAQAIACPYCGFPMSNHLALNPKLIKKQRGCLELSGIAFLIFTFMSIMLVMISKNETDITNNAISPTQAIKPNAPQIENEVNAGAEKPKGYSPPIGEQIQSRDSAIYTLMDIKFKDNRVIITTQRDGKSGRSYSAREVKCPSKEARYLATGDTMAEFKDSKMKQSFSESYPDSIQGEVASYACTQLFLKNLDKK